MSRVLITDYINDPYIEKQTLGADLSEYAHEDINVLMVWHQKINSKYLKQFPNIKGVFRYGVGYDNIDLDYLKENEIIFCNNPEYGTDEVSNTAIAFLVSDSRKIFEYNSIAKQMPTTWQENTIKPIKTFSETKVLSIGAGRIGKNFLTKAHALGFKTAFFDPYVPQNEINYAKKIDDACQFSDFDVISIHCLLNNETEGIIDDLILPNISKNTHLINTARGGLLRDAEILFKKIESKHISKISFDVLPEEPPCENEILIQEWLNGSERIIINPHTSYYSQQSYIRMRETISRNVKDFLDGKEPKYKIC